MDTKALAPIARACMACGSGSALASAVGKTPQFISQMVRMERPVPAELCPTIERITRAAAAAKGDSSLVVTCEELRPDVAWGVLREQVAEQTTSEPKAKAA